MPTDHERAIAEMEDALRDCGVTDSSLTADEKDALDRRGYFVARDVVDPEWLEQMRGALDDAVQPASASAPKQTGTHHVESLLDRHAAFDRIYTHPKVLASAHRVLAAPFRVCQLSGRVPLPGFGGQGLHAD